jgi:flagellin-like hook-associated protein FlgL
MIINTNSGSASAARLLGNATDALQKSLQRLSSGKKNTLLSDDIAGVVVGDKFYDEIKRMSA